MSPQDPGNQVTDPRVPAIHADPPHIPDHEMVRCIGRGSYGEVWLATNAVGTWRAVKVVYRDNFDDPRPFEREFVGIQKYEPLSRTNEGLVDVLQIGRNDLGRYFYYVMELADHAACRDCAATGKNSGTERGEGLGMECTGETPDLPISKYSPKTLASEIKARGVIPVGECIPLGITLCLAVGHLHRHGLIHRDVKPSNIIFVKGVPKLADIGLVANQGDAESFVGTEGFIPPEGPNTPLGDIYALGKVLYEASMGKDRHDFPEPRSKLALDADSRALMELNAVLLRACAPEVKNRYQSAEKMNVDLALLHSGESVHQKHRLERRVRFLTRAGAVTLAVMVLGAFPYYLAIKEARMAKTEAEEKAHQAGRADREANHARQAEAAMRESLRKAYLMQAEAGRWSARPGRRFDGLEALKKAAEIRPGLDLRNEAIACMALTDLRETQKISADPDCLLVFDSTYDRFATPDLQGTIHIRRRQDSAELFQFTGYKGPFWDLEFSPDGKLLLVACQPMGDRIELLDLERKAVALRVPGPYYRTMSFSRDSSLAAITFDLHDRWPVEIFDLKSRKQIASFTTGSLPFYIRFNPSNSDLVLISDHSPVVRIVDWKSGAVVQSLAHPDWVTGIDWHPDGKTVATGCADNKVRLWNAASGKERAALAGHEWVPVWVSFSGDGQFLASRGWEGILRIWDPSAERELIHKTLNGGLFPFSSSGHLLEGWMGDGRYEVMEVSPGVGYKVLRGPPEQLLTSCDFSPNGELLASAHEASMQFWNLKEGEGAASVSKKSERTWCGYVAFSPGGGSVYLGCNGGVEEWQLKARSGTNIELALERTFALQGRSGPISLGKDGKVLAVRSEDALHVFDLPSGLEIHRIEATPKDIWSALSPDGKLAATWTVLTNRVAFWDLERSNVVQWLPTRPSTGVAFSPDNNLIVVGDESEFRAYDRRTWHPKYTLPREVGGYFAHMAFSHDGSLLAAVTSRTTVRLVEAASGRELATFEPPERHDIKDVVFNTQDTQLAVACGVIQLWDLGIIRKQLASMNLDWDVQPYKEPALVRRK